MPNAFITRLLALSCALVLVACSDRDAPPAPPVQPPNPLEQILEEGALSLGGVTDAGLNPSEPTLKFVLRTATFASDAKEITLTINEEPVDPAVMQLAPGQILVPVKLKDGRNDIAFKAYDSRSSCRPAQPYQPCLTRLMEMP